MFKHLQPFTVCNEIVDYGQIVYIGLKKDVSIYMMDPYRFTNHRLNTLSMKGDNIFIPELTYSDKSTLVNARVTTNVLEKRHDKGNCKKYQSASAYSMCIENGYINLFKKVLGCVPPWFRQESKDTSIVCTKQIHFNDEKIAAKAQEQLDKIMTDMKFMEDSKYEKEWCLLPCRQLYYDVKIVQTDKGSYDQNWMNIRFADAVSIKTETIGYDSFRKRYYKYR